ncbi:MAG: hypothetical protein J6W00_12685 [Lentisphaeria bacterium]|nr:hypothetical protein [Lentisphaeria bacterium]
MLRYISKGEIHKDFHGLTCATLHYLCDNYGEEAMREVLTGTAQKVYETIHEKLKQGDPGELLEFWEYYFKRENGDFEIEKYEDEIRLIVKDCPALRHLVKLEQEPDPILCDATRIFNDALTENTPFQISTEQTGTFSCRQILKKQEAENVSE